MNPGDKVFESESLIRFSDCDPFNHLNNSRYIDYFINAREDHLLQFQGFNLYKYAMEKGLSWVVSMTHIAYLKPAFLNETVIIQSTLRQLKEKEVWVEMLMWNKEKTVLKSLFWSQLTHYNLQTKKAEVHSQELYDLFKPLENPLSNPVNFEDRITEIKNRTAVEKI
jgi:YbgC/YbaW family acyl-CoA thioester hydrolase